MKTSRLGILTLILLAVVTFISPVTIPHASADPGGRLAYHDYFTNANAPNFGKSVILGGIPPSAYSKAGFINFILANLAGGGRNQTGAQFIIQMMRGAPYHYNRPTAFPGDPDVAAWKALVNQPSVTTSVQTVGYTWDAAYDINNNDDYYFNWGSPKFAPALVFWQNGSAVFEIRLACANPIGDLPGIAPTPPPVWALTSSTTVNKASGYPGEVATFTHSIIKSGSGAAAYRYIICGAYYSFYTTAPGGCGAWSGVVTGSVTLNHAVTLSAAQQGNYYCERILYSPNGSAGGLGSSSGKCVRVTPVVFSCGAMNITPSSGLDPQTKFSITVSASSNDPTPIAGAAITLTIRPRGGGAGWSYGPTTQVIPVPSNPVFATFSNLGPTNQTGMWDVSWQYTAPGGFVKNCGMPFDASASFSVANKPYLHVYGGDVLAGSTAVNNGGSQQCYTDPNPNNQSGIYSWNNHTTDFSGAGAQYAVMALDQILDFSSASGSGASAASLSFANAGLPASKLNTANGLFGGYLGTTTTPCDFTSDMASPTKAPLILNTTTVAKGTVQTHYVIGANVFITGSGIRYDTNGWIKPADIPYFKLVVVGGNIYIDASVTQLDGVYVAEKNLGGAGGTIYTCATGLGQPANPTQFGVFYNQCHQKLTINGAFVAQQVQFLRTLGTVGMASGDTWRTNNAAEVFNYSPEVWIPRSAGLNLNSSYDAITGLPPTL